MPKRTHVPAFTKFEILPYGESFRFSVRCQDWFYEFTEDESTIIHRLLNNTKLLETYLAGMELPHPEKIAEILQAEVRQCSS